MTKISQFLIAVLILIGSFKATASDEVPIAKIKDLELVSFISSVRTCLKKKDRSCLAEYVRFEFYFPVQGDFGCKTKDPKKMNITASEFAVCVNNVESHQLPHEGATLFQALDDCFNAPNARWIMNSYLVGKTGHGCYIRKYKGRYRLDTVLPGC